MSTSVPEQTIRHGDVGYLMWQTPDVEAAAGFYAHVLGWQIAAGTVPEGRQVTNTTVGVGLWGGQPHSTAYCCFAVDSVDEAVVGVRARGGTADEPRNEPYGRIADCVDDQGLSFAVYQPEPRAPRPPVNGARAGDVAYLTFEVPDADAAHAFYGALLGWRPTSEAAVDCGRPGAHARRCRRPGCHRGAHLDRRGHSRRRGTGAGRRAARPPTQSTARTGGWPSALTATVAGSTSATGPSAASPPNVGNRVAGDSARRGRVATLPRRVTLQPPRNSAQRGNVATVSRGLTLAGPFSSTQRGKVATVPAR